jgi:hypothetical protein
MRMKHLFFTLLIVGIHHSYAQQCQVTVTAIAGSYNGECKDNKAEGFGKAVGEDSYEGNFKEGYPNGKGKYVWKNGSWFEGNFKKGLKDGEGIMHIKNEQGADSIVTGTWKNDVFNKKNDRKYIIHTKSYGIQTVSINADKSGSGLNEINLTLESISGGSFDMHGEIPKPQLTMVEVKQGSYVMRSDVNNMQKRMLVYLRDVVFPFRAVFRITQGSVLEDVEIEFLETSRWKVDIKLRQ